MPDVGRKAPKGKTHKQSIRFDADKWTKAKSKKWVKDHDGYTDGYEYFVSKDKKSKEHRWRQYDPDKKNFHYRKYDKDLPDGCYFIMGYPGAEKEDRKMSRLEIRGVIVPSAYDQDYFKKYIDKGVITPESHFRAQLKRIAKDQPLEIYINSPGGSVFAGNEMINAARDWKAAAKQDVTITVGALAASMAAAFSVSVGDRLRAHSNAKMMFHGAWTITLGGKEAHEDTADLLNKINADIMTKLIDRYEIDPDLVATWFAEGREGWLTAKQMKEYGIAAEIIGEEDQPIDFTEDTISDLDSQGLKIAALLEATKGETDNGREDLGNDADEDGEGEGEGDADGSDDEGSGDSAGGEGEDTGENDSEGDGSEGDGEGDSDTDGGSGGEGDEGSSEDAGGEDGGEGQDGQGDNQEGGEGDNTQEAIDLTGAQYLAGVEAGRRIAQAGAAEQIQEKENQRRALQAERDQLKAKIEKQKTELENQIKDLSARLKDANAQHAKLINGGLEFSTGPAEPRTWQEALETCGGDYAKAAAAYPELKAEYNRKHSRK
jgi:ATP-dependent protease ClpP protease subunit